MKTQNWFDGLTADDLPGDLQLVAQECGVETALLLAERMGGMKLYIVQAGQALLPAKKRFIKANRHRTVRELVLATRLSETTVRDLLREIEQDDRQGKLL